MFLAIPIIVCILIAYALFKNISNGYLIALILLISPYYWALAIWILIMYIVLQNIPINRLFITLIFTLLTFIQWPVVMHYRLYDKVGILPTIVAIVGLLIYKNARRRRQQ